MTTKPKVRNNEGIKCTRHGKVVLGFQPAVVNFVKEDNGRFNGSTKTTEWARPVCVDCKL